MLVFIASDQVKGEKRKKQSIYISFSSIKRRKKNDASSEIIWALERNRHQHPLSSEKRMKNEITWRGKWRADERSSFEGSWTSFHCRNIVENWKKNRKRRRRRRPIYQLAIADECWTWGVERDGLSKWRIICNMCRTSGSQWLRASWSLYNFCMKSYSFSSRMIR